MLVLLRALCALVGETFSLLEVAVASPEALASHLPHYWIMFGDFFLIIIWVLCGDPPDIGRGDYLDAVCLLMHGLHELVRTRTCLGTEPFRIS